MRMKKIIGLVLALVMVLGIMPMGTIKAYAAEGDVAINETNFPDATFREYIKTKFDTDKNGTLSQQERNGVTKITVDKKQIESLKGIEHFPKVWKIGCKNNKLRELDVRQNKDLEMLYCDHNNLVRLDLSQNTALTDLNCSNNQLENLDVKENTKLEKFWCSDNNLTKLEVSEKKLSTFWIAVPTN